jgi:hypothetical protein
MFDEGFPAGLSHQLPRTIIFTAKVLQRPNERRNASIYRDLCLAIFIPCWRGQKNASSSEDSGDAQIPKILLPEATRGYFENECGTYQRVYVANPSTNSSHQSTSPLRIHNL